MILLLVQNKNKQIPFIGTGFFDASTSNDNDRANTDTEPKYQNATTGTGTIVQCHYQ
jgi:hypothetical protein